MQLKPAEVLFTALRPRHITRQAVYSMGPANRSPHVAISGENRQQHTPTDSVRMRIIGANHDVIVEGLRQSHASTNYFFGKDPTDWKLDIPTFHAVQYRNLYSGIDLVLRASATGQFEYDWVVAAGADPSLIHFVFDGVQSVDVDSRGDLNLHSSYGLLQNRAPLIFQEVNGVRQTVPGRFEVRKGNRVDLS